MESTAAEPHQVADGVYPLPPSCNLDDTTVQQILTDFKLTEISAEYEEYQRKDKSSTEMAEKTSYSKRTFGYVALHTWLR